MPSLYQDIGPELIEQVIEEFYFRAFQDPIIGHLFWGFNQQHLVEMQTQFAKAMLGGEASYQGKPLELAHSPLHINGAHFGRRQVLMNEVLSSFSIPPELCQQWLLREERLRPLIVKSDRTCQS